MLTFLAVDPGRKDDKNAGCRARRGVMDGDKLRLRTARKAARCRQRRKHTAKTMALCLEHGQPGETTLYTVVDTVRHWHSLRQP